MIYCFGKLQNNINILISVSLHPWPHNSTYKDHSKTLFLWNFIIEVPACRNAYISTSSFFFPNITCGKSKTKVELSNLKLFLTFQYTSISKIVFLRVCIVHSRINIKYFPYLQKVGSKPWFKIVSTLFIYLVNKQLWCHHHRI